MLSIPLLWKILYGCGHKWPEHQTWTEPKGKFGLSQVLFKLALSCYCSGPALLAKCTYLDGLCVSV